MFLKRFEILHKISYPYIERCGFYSQVKIEELLDLRTHKCFWNAWRHQANTWTNVNLSSVRSNSNHLRENSQEAHQPPITKISFKSPRGHWVNHHCLFNKSVLTYHLRYHLYKCHSKFRYFFHWLKWPHYHLWPLLLTWFNFNPSMDK